MGGILRLERPEETVRAKWMALLTAGLLLVGLGLTALVLPFFAPGIQTGTFAGLILLLAAACLVLTIVALKTWWTLVLTLLPLLAGLILFLICRRVDYWPGAILGWLFLAQAPFRLVTGFNLRPTLLWHWPAWAGLTPFMAGIMALIGWLAKELWAIGLLLGVDLMHSGLAWIVIALAGRADWD